MVATLQTTNIQNAASSTTNLALDTSGNVTVGSSLTAANNITATSGTVVMASSFLRNRIINGGMQIWQRGTSFSTPASGNYTADRMYVGWTGAAPASVTQVTGPTGFTYAARITGAASNTLVTFGQKIESVNCADLASKTVTVSAVLLASTSQTFTWAIFYANSTDNFSSSTQIATGSWSVTTSAATYTATISLPSQAANGLQFQVYPNSAGAFTSGTFDITGLQLEQGSVATPFERRLYGQELALCQRYFYKMGAGSVYANFGMGRAYSTTNGQTSFSLPVSMRAAPTGSYSALTDFNAAQTSGNITAFIIPSAYSTDYRQMMVDITATFSSGQTIALNANNTTNAYMTFSAEL